MRQSNPTSRLRDADNAQQSSLSFQRKAVENFHTTQNQILPEDTSVSHPVSPLPEQPPQLNTPSQSKSVTAILPTVVQQASPNQSNVIISDGDVDVQEILDDDDEQPKPGTALFSRFESHLISLSPQRKREKPVSKL